jgi:hypothetical protein
MVLSGVRGIQNAFQSTGNKVGAKKKIGENLDKLELSREFFISCHNQY